LADLSSDPISERVQGVNWLVGLSGAAIGGALLKFDWLLALHPAAKVLFLVASSLFFGSILCGVYYVFQLFAVRRNQGNLGQIKSQWPADEKAVNAATSDLNRVTGRARTFQDLTILAFLGASVTSILALGVALFSPRPTSEPPQSKYLLSTFEVRLRGTPLHTHTFLLNQQTGEIWEMLCRKGGTVEFRRVRKTAYDGSQEEPPAPKAPPVSIVPEPH
jgi:hypothetical protein